MTIEPAVRRHPTPWIIIGSILLASILSAGLTLLAVFGTTHPGTPPAAATTTTELGAGPPPATSYRPAPQAERPPEGYYQSLFFSGIFGLVIALVGVTMVSYRRRMW